MSDLAGRYMKQAAAQLEQLDGTLARATAGAGGFHDEAIAIQESVRAAARLASDLARRMRSDDS